MAGCSARGPLGFGLHLIDEGTLCRHSSMAPRIVGSSSLSVDAALLGDASHATFRWTIQEALRRGARELDLSLLAAKYSSWAKTARGGDGPLSEVIQRIESDWVRAVVGQEQSAFDAMIEAEVARMPALIGADRAIKDKDDYRYRVRPLYYSHGYRDSARFLEKVRPFMLFGRFEVLIHEDLATLLERLPRILDDWSSGLAASTAREIRGVLGIQIRTIAGSSVLSNHAFGLAIDIDPLSNPHVVTRSAIDVLNWVASTYSVAFDFGKTILSAQERGHAGHTLDDIVEIHNRAQTASEAVRSWLLRHLPRYRSLIEQVQSAEKQLGLNHVKPATKLEDRARAVQTARDRIARRNELKSATNTCEPVSAASLEGRAAETAATALGAIAGDEDLRRIQVLYEDFEPGYVATWEKRGVLTVPLYLACALVGKLGLRWGEQYESSKDAMHFELVGKGKQPYIPPEAPLARGEKPRTLKQLMEEAFAGAWRLEKPALLQAGHRRR